jgi:DNA polymerase-3 subunit gamma/tau
LHDAQIASVDGDLITLTAPSATLARMIGEDSNVEVMRAALRDEVGGDWRITVQVLDTPPAAARSVERDPRDETDFAAPTPPPIDPEADALDLLQTRLGARPVES